MPDVEAFMERVVLESRRRLALLDDDADRGAAEDTVLLLTDYRLQGIDVAGFETLLASLKAGRSPVSLTERSESLANELAGRWEAYTREGAAVLA